jgi:RNA polymerase sigma-70 factor (ECF subfamily)
VAADDDPLSGRVPTTVWAQTKLAGLESSEGKQAFSQLAGRYWYPIFCFVRRKFGANGAEDLTQGFFVDLTENNDLAQVDPAKGRFRSWLLKRVQNFVIDQKRVDGALKRGGGKRPISFDVELAEESFRFRVHDDATPEDAYAHGYALAVMADAMQRLGAVYVQDHGQARWEALSRFLLDDPEPGEAARLAESIGMSATAFSSALSRLVPRYRAYCEAELEELGSKDPQGEFRELVGLVE